MIQTIFSVWNEKYSNLLEGINGPEGCSPNPCKETSEHMYYLFAIIHSWIIRLHIQLPIFGKNPIVIISFILL